MRRRIDLLDKHYIVTLFNQNGRHLLQVSEGEFTPAMLKIGTNHQAIVQIGSQRAEMNLAVKGEVAYIRAFDRTFTLKIVDPVEQAAQESGNISNTARAPMPGTVVEVHVVVGDAVSKGQRLITIESMKILMVITSPRDGKVSKVHFEPGNTFDKNSALVTLRGEEEN
jgi:3-methylcrotonyl-CoA carboxylase alpha subunit